MSQPALNITIDQRSAVPLYEQICQQIREQIEAGQLPVGASLPTNHELCDQLQIAYKTAQRAMSNLAREGYVTRQARRGTVVKGVPRRGLVAIYSWMQLFSPDSKHEYYRLLIGHLSSLLEKHGQDYRTYLGSETNAAANTASDDLLQHIASGAVTAALLVNHFPQPALLANQAKAMHCPIVSLIDKTHATCSVLVDTPAYVKAAAAHLHKQGRQRTGIIYNRAGRLLHQTGSSLNQLLTDAGCTTKPTWLAGNMDTEQGGYDAARSLPLDELDSLIITDDIMALGVSRHLREANAKAPHDLQVTTLWQKHSRLKLELPFTRFEVDVQEQAQLALQLLQAAVAGQRIKSPHITVVPVCREIHK